MSHTYTIEEQNWIADNCRGHYIAEIVEKFNKKFNENINYGQIKNYLHNHNLKNGMLLKKRPIYKIVEQHLTPEELEIFEKNNKGKTIPEMMIFCADNFGKIFTPAQIRQIKHKHHFKSDIDTKFKKGHNPYNKGKKGLFYPGMEKTWFKKGHLPYNTVPVGTEVIDYDGYKKIKIAMPDVWEYVHKLVWKEVHGEIPKGHMIIFLDGNKTNLNVENLELIPMRHNLFLNSHGLRLDSKELTKAGIAIAQFKDKINELDK